MTQKYEGHSGMSRIGVVGNKKTSKSIIVLDEPVRIKQEALDDDERRQAPEEGQNEGSGDASE